MNVTAETYCSNMLPAAAQLEVAPPLQPSNGPQASFSRTSRPEPQAATHHPQGVQGARPRTTQAASMNRASISRAICVWRHTSAHTFCGTG